MLDSLLRHDRTALAACAGAKPRACWRRSMDKSPKRQSLQSRMCESSASANGPVRSTCATRTSKMYSSTAHRSPKVRLSNSDPKSLFHACLHLLQHAPRLARRIHSESHCNYFRLDLCLPSFGKVKMVTQYAQIAWAGCLGVRR